MEYTYKVIQMQTDDSKAEGFVCRAFIEMTATSEAGTSIAYEFDEKFKFIDEEQMTPFLELTESQVVQWALLQKGEQWLSRLKSNLEKLLIAKENISEIKSVELPWN